LDDLELEREESMQDKRAKHFERLFSSPTHPTKSTNENEEDDEKEKDS